ncbi:hypothetical protein LTR99_008876 [Exophiala xenobiotica]|nr:hypothetical protein LTR96_009145 [Exophiala xenobiotica]KAK5296509.1 hypothetical protein LTR99_008876 [Exophiala xenobiotica]KAK5334562.1 hypothetical protein LTR98_009516 [Exophiala xenobiotica]KAK5427733.1 hypothetical protein LTR34_008675 [Exophiala xenobiotica]KAK5537085.1 hypothetical protein LTR23_007634 [Chaetothyriales sp. CCFEE 6169]
MSNQTNRPPRPPPLQTNVRHARPGSSRSNNSRMSTSLSQASPASADSASTYEHPPDEAMLMPRFMLRNAISDIESAARALQIATSSNERAMNTLMLALACNDDRSHAARTAYNLPNSPTLSSISFLNTPISSIYSPPPYWRDALPQEPMTLTFGIELEHVFAFYMNPGDSFEWMGSSFEDRDCGGNHEDGPSSRVLGADIAGPVSPPRSRLGQPCCTMPVALSVLHQAGLNGVINGSGYASWSLDKDLSIRYSADLCSDLPGKVDLATEEYWMQGRHELVSRVLTAPDKLTFGTFKSSSAMQEVEEYLEAIHGTSTDPWGSFVNKSCGFHVHVARSRASPDSDEMLPLPVLQHLAYLLVQFEELITALHEPERRSRGDGDSLFVASNLMGLRRSEHLCRRIDELNLATAQKKIFSKDMTAQRLAKMMDTEFRAEDREGNSFSTGRLTRYKFVNFQRLTQTGEAKTIEFREHKGTVGFDEISHWVHFILSLVRAAERMAKDPTGPHSPMSPREHMSFRRQQAAKCTIRCAKLRDEFERLLELLEFDDETRWYWRLRFVQLNPAEVLQVEQDENGVERIAEDGRCPACAQDDEDRQMFADREQFSARPSSSGSAMSLGSSP